MPGVESTERVSAWRKCYLNPPLDATARVSDDASPMPDTLLVLAVVLLLAVLVLLVVLLVRPARVNLAEVEARLAAVEAGHAQIERALRDEMAQGRTESTGQGRALREEVGGAVARLGDSLSSQLGTFSESNERRMDALRQSVEERLRALLEDNAARLEQMRVTVDERLQGTLEARLGESFRVVSERLEQVHRGLGEMQALAAGRRRPEEGAHQRQDARHVGRGAARHAARAGAGAGAVRRERRDQVGQRGPRRVRDQAAGPRPGGHGRVAADRREVPAGGLPAAARGVGPRRRRRGGGGREGSSRCASRRRRRTSATSTSTRRTRPTSASCSCRPRGSTRRCCAGRAWPTSSSATCAWCWPGRPRCGRCSTACRWGSARWRSRSGRAKSGRVLGTVKTQFAKFGDIVSAVQKKLQEATNKMDAIARQSRTIERKLRDVQELPAGEPHTPCAARTDAARAGRGGRRRRRGRRARTEDAAAAACAACSRRRASAAVTAPVPAIPTSPRPSPFSSFSHLIEPVVVSRQ